MNQIIKIAAISVSDRASSGEYIDKAIPTIEDWLHRAITTKFEFISKIIPDEKAEIEKTLIEFVDQQNCNLIFTIGGTGPAKRDVTPEATTNVVEKLLPGFGEQMRQISLQFVPTAILSRQTAGIRNQALIINLPGQPKSIIETFEGVKDKNDQVVVEGIFRAIPYCVELICGAIIQTNPNVVMAFRPKSAPAIK